MARWEKEKNALLSSFLSFRDEIILEGCSFVSF